MTIKIRMGWDQDQMNADEIIHIAKESGIAFAAIHGRTRAQQYTGKANWEYLENLASKKILPLVGNGDLHSPQYAARARLKQTSCDS